METLRSPFLEKEEENGEIRVGSLIQGIPNDLSLDAHLILNPTQITRKSWIKSKKLWAISSPVIFTAICQYSLGEITHTFARNLSTIELAVVAIENYVIGRISFRVMLGMGSALETLCGQAFGGAQIHMLGVYMKRSWIILLVTESELSLIYIFSPPILKLFGQSDEILTWLEGFPS